MLLERIERRGRSFERDFDRGYLSDLSRAYQTFFHDYTDTPLLDLDNSELDYADDGDAGRAVMDEIFERLVGLVDLNAPRRTPPARPLEAGS